MSEAERYTAIAFYHMQVSEDRARALAAYRALLEISPEDASLNNIGILYSALGDNDAAIDAFRRAMAKDSMLSQPYMNIGFPLIELHRLDEAAQNVEQFARRFGDGPDAELMRSWLAVVRGDYDDAEHELDPCDYCSLEAIARAHYNAGRLDSAAVYYQRYTDTPAGDRIFYDGFYLGPVLERLTDVYMTLNRPQDAAAAAARFVALWENADAELQPRVQAKRELLVRLQERVR